MTEQNFETVVHARARLVKILTTLMILLYFGFISLVAFNRQFLARRVTDGLSVGILLGALVIVLSWVTTWIYVRWTNKNYDPHLERIRGESQ
ncbi:MAG TPA: DUF485 domain-containing protein [Longimicrobiales bacterium]|nr:DUF485 domain-containing protein [Longimicrobiales bacterium]